ncbi:hypothetical protein A8E62_13840 [Burkholderia cenocepacia]|nr:hypothetical protein A8E62_13840 [Burkholderia cenocepacia]ONU91449.1 hypothetical protein A8E63_10130 [Burkholderia cenocepacia]
MQLPKTAKNRNLETVRIRVLPPVLLAPLRRPSPAPLRRPATADAGLPAARWLYRTEHSQTMKSMLANEYFAQRSRSHRFGASGYHPSGVRGSMTPPADCSLGARTCKHQRLLCAALDLDPFHPCLAYLES